MNEDSLLKANETLNNSAEEFNGFKGSNVEDNIPQERLPNEQSEQLFNAQYHHTNSTYLDNSFKQSTTQLYE